MLVSDLEPTMRGRYSPRPTLRIVAMVAVLIAVAAATFSATTPARGQGDPAATDANPPAATTGQEAIADDAKLSDQPLYRISQLYGFSPIINGLIIGLSVLAVMFFIWFMLTINNRTMAPPGLVDEVVKLVLRGDYERGRRCVPA